MKRYRFKENLNLLYSDIYFKLMLLLLIVVFVLVKVFPLIGIHINPVFSSSDQNGLYLTFQNKKTTYSNNDYVSFCLTNKLALKNAESFDLPIKGGDCPNQSAPLLKHICGIPGDNILYIYNGFYNNGMFINNDYIKSNKIIHLIDWKVNNSYTLKRNEYFICGANKLSFDSRYYGAVNYNDLYGKSYLLIKF